jgi:hypothetical protein
MIGGRDDHYTTPQGHLDKFFGIHKLLHSEQFGDSVG